MSPVIGTILSDRRSPTGRIASGGSSEVRCRAALDHPISTTSSSSSQGDPAQSTSTTAESTGTTTTIASPSPASSMPRHRARVTDPARGHQDTKDGKQ